MHARCNGGHASYKHYGAKGISVCPEWKTFTGFSRWALANGYQDHLTIDRNKTTDNYSPETCKWVTRAENTRNQLAEGHPNATAVVLFLPYRETLQFKSIAKAGRYLDKIFLTRPKTSATALEKRIKANSLKPYKGYQIMRASI